MADIHYKLKIDEHDFKFSDNWENEDSISNFEIVMDMYPVYHAYKLRNSLDEEITKSIINVASLVSDKLLSFHHSKIFSYKRVKNLIDELNEYQPFFNSYNEIVQSYYVEEAFHNDEKFLVDFDTDKLENFINNININNNRIVQAFKDTYAFFIKNGIARIKSKENQYSRNRSVNYYLKHRLNHELFLNFNCISEACCLLNKKSIASYNVHFLEELRKNPVDYLNEALGFCKQTLGEFPKSTDSNYIKMMQTIDDNINRHFKGKEAEKYSRKKSGCFAIMAHSSEPLYYAISGLRRRELTTEVVDLCNDIEKLFDEKMTRCCVTDTMIRYKDDNITSTTFIQEIPSGSTPDSDLESLYTCCERKILANLPTPPIKGSYFIRWAPCRKCIPALFDNYRAIYAFSPSSKQRNYDSSRMIRYEITNNFKLREL